MVDPRHVAERMLGPVDWQTEVSGFCRCPGEAFHTSHDGKKDCRVNVDGAPTIFCFHASCAPAVAEANRRLRRELGASPWELRLPDGRQLRSGDVLLKDGAISRQDAKTQSCAGGAGAAGERMLLESLRVNAERFRPELFEFFRWPMARILEGLAFAGRPPRPGGPVPDLAEVVAGVLDGFGSGMSTARANRSTRRIFGRWRSGTRLGR
jgi:hypothetical protein